MTTWDAGFNPVVNRKTVEFKRCTVEPVVESWISCRHQIVLYRHIDRLEFLVDSTRRVVLPEEIERIGRLRWFRAGDIRDRNAEPLRQSENRFVRRIDQLATALCDL